MEWRDRNGQLVPGEGSKDELLTYLYTKPLGRMIVSIMIRPWVSELAGRFMDSRISALQIKSFIKKNRIDMSQFENRRFRSFNDFFTRKIAPGKRVIDTEEKHLIAPCDSKLCVYPITEDSTFEVKQTKYTLASLLRDEELAKRYEGGTFLLFRLTVGDYHRYCHIDRGIQGKEVHLQGVYHTVNPVANDHYPIYKENTREYTLVETENFGTVLMMEVGAAMVGRIVNYAEDTKVVRGQEKGKFEFGGSTVILCLEKDRVKMDEDILENTKNAIETVVKMGMKIGEAI